MASNEMKDFFAEAEEMRRGYADAICKNQVDGVYHPRGAADFLRPQPVRTFESGATRSPLGDKLQYEGYLNPLVLKRFAEYMKKHQIQSNGEVRSADNWQKNIPKESLMDSGYRHFQDWHLHHRGYGAQATEDLEESLCALLFNTMAYLKATLDGA